MFSCLVSIVAGCYLLMFLVVYWILCYSVDFITIFYIAFGLLLVCQQVTILCYHSAQTNLMPENEQMQTQLQTYGSEECELMEGSVQVIAT